MTLLQVRGLCKHYAAEDGSRAQALSDVSFDIERGEVLGVVGESGCGKSTLGRTLLRLVEPDAGSVHFDGIPMETMRSRDLKVLRRDMQIIFQDPFGSLNPRHTVGRIVREPLDVHRVGSRLERRRRVARLLDRVGLPSSAAASMPHEFSGGQRQRIAIARALAFEPRFLVADEAVSALDVSIQSQIINLLTELQQALSITLLFIGHDLSVVRHISNRMAVMYMGRIVETGATESIMTQPSHPYTQALISAIPRLDESSGERIVLAGEVPDPAHLPPGCAFCSRCPEAMPVCRIEQPLLTERRIEATGSAVTTACHLHPAIGAPLRRAAT